MWCPHATRIEWTGPDGGAYLKGVPNRGVLHTTEANWFTPSSSQFYGHNNPPHIVVDRWGRAFQYISAERAARALKHPKRTQDTNRMRAFQIEIVGYARAINAMPAVQAVKLRAVMRWAEASLGIKREMPLEFRGSEAWGSNTPYRMDKKQWAAFDAWCGHQHVGSGNEHWDPGRLNPKLLLESLKWEQPGDSIRVGADAIAAARYQGGNVPARLVANINQEETQIMIGRLLDIAMRHHERLEDLEES